MGLSHLGRGSEGGSHAQCAQYHPRYSRNSGERTDVAGHAGSKYAGRNVVYSKYSDRPRLARCSTGPHEKLSTRASATALEFRFGLFGVIGPGRGCVLELA